MHPEGGHIVCQRLAGDDYPGDCPYHGACIEGMTNAKAVADRAGITPNLLATLSDDHPVWNVHGYYLAQFCAALIYLTSVKRIVIGGGLLKRTILFTHIRKHVLQTLNNYMNISAITDDIDNYIVPSSLGDLIGIQSAFDIAQFLIAKQ